MSLRRPTMLAVATLTALTMSAGPASAHFCFKTELNERAAAGMAGSAGWVSFGDLAREFTGLCPAGIQVLADAAGVKTSTLINAHGLMAAGLVKQGRHNKAIGHLDFAAIDAAFPEAAAACG